MFHPGGRDSGCELSDSRLNRTRFLTGLSSPEAAVNPNRWVGNAVDIDFWREVG